MKSHIPNTITLLNLLCGCICIIAVLIQEWNIAIILFCVGLLADFFDGFFAKRLNVHSALGVQLDSLADIVTFGLLPSIICFQLLAISLNILDFENIQNIAEHLKSNIWRLIPAFIIVCAAAVRLARYNIDDSQKSDFEGLATPSSAMFFVGLLAIHSNNILGMGNLVTHPVVIYGSILIISYLMLSSLPMVSLKVKSYSWKGNQLRYFLLIGFLVFVVLIKGGAFSLIIVIYIIASLIQYISKT